MPILEWKAQRSAILRILAAAGLGAVFGFLSWRLAEHGVAAIAAGLAGGLLIALVSGRLLLPARKSIDSGCSTAKQAAGAGNPKLKKCGVSAIRHRLAEDKAILEYLDAERERRREPSFGKTTEERVVWGELLKLELQDLDEQLSRICDAAGGATSRNPRGSKEPNANPRKGGFRGRNDS
jgi:hypothetical protein